MACCPHLRLFRCEDNKVNNISLILEKNPGTCNSQANLSKRKVPFPHSTVMPISFRAFNYTFCSLYILALIIYFGAAIILFCTHRTLLVYRPNTPPDSRKKVITPMEAEYGEGEWQEMWINSQDGTRLHAYLLK